MFKNKRTIRSHHFALLFTVPVLGVPALSWVGCGGDSAQNPSEVAVSDTGMTFEEFRATVYQEPDTGVYIVNGDTPIHGDRELERFYLELVGASELTSQSGAEPLIVRHLNGVDAKWNDTQKMNLTYCVSTTFGSRYNMTVSAMEAAASAWEEAANHTVEFVHLSANDSTCTATNTNVVFDVRPVTGQPYFARAFWPDSVRAQRNVLIDSTAFTIAPPITLIGVLRHELGHALGFRHEHTRPEAGTCLESSGWRPLTLYDSASIMHYPWCNGTNTGDLVITPKDQEGVNLLYNTGCNHSKCLAGPALNAARCGAAVTSVCTVDPYCCSMAWDDTCVSEVYITGGNLSCKIDSCGHPLCETGIALTPGCDTSGHVAAICAVDPFCCDMTNGEWDSVCVGEVTSITGKSCN